MQAKTGVLLVNLGTPDSPRTKDVRSYLFQFLNDKRVIDLPWLFRKILVNGIIVPFRAPKSAKVYKELWTEKGSPIIYHTHNLCEKLKMSLGSDFHVEYAMRYKNPSLKKTLSSWENKNFKQIIKTEKISIVAKLDILSTLFLSSLGSLLWSLNFIYVFM